MEIAKDDLDRFLIHTVRREGEITLSKLLKTYPELQTLPYSLLHYRVTTLGEEGCIHVEKARRNLVLCAVEQ